MKKSVCARLLWLATIATLIVPAPGYEVAAAAKERSKKLKFRTIAHFTDNLYLPCKVAEAGTKTVLSVLGIGELHVSGGIDEDGKEAKWRVALGDATHWVRIEGETIEVAEGKYIAAYPDLLGRLRLRPANAMRTKLGSNQLHFIDEDFDGNHFEPGVDSVLVREKARYVIPYMKEMAFDDAVYSFRGVKPDPDKSTDESNPGDRNEDLHLFYMKKEFTTKSEAEDVHETLNALRNSFGLPGVSCDETWNEHCRAHCDYMKRNDVFTHSEDPQLPGYSREGHAAGMTSVLSRGNGRAEDSVFGLFDTPLHGYHLRAPGLVRSAIGRNKEFTAIRSSGVRCLQPVQQTPMVFPPDNATGIPTHWAGREQPNPMLEEGKGLGYPITFHLYAPRGLDRAQVTAEAITGRVPAPPYKLEFILEVKTRKGWEPVPCQLSYNRETVTQSMLQRGVIMAYALPLEKLRSFSLHRMTTRWLESKPLDAPVVEGDGDVMNVLVTSFTTSDERGSNRWHHEQVGNPRLPDTRDRR